ncbi:YqaJ-like recombinase protein [Rathayibacter sp. PhB127]|uniref:lambda exonuclease family protein n=1 Tax=Rathayibacter sp. PhB127 TaxID=2485176 RepID=UPI000FB06657|nr:lambda exonuclease family protein [Rathayibacter sp. PhB127]ROS28882.1 YqaJ-like recombinase protein [Rathayibacter sp. PhB127]
MNIQIYTDLEQGSPDWLAARCGLATASTIGKLLTTTGRLANNDTSRALTETLIAERISQHVDYVHPSFDMQRGTLDEPYARQLYAEQYAPVEEIGFAVRSIGELQIGASPDGLVGSDGGIEIKSRRPRTQLTTTLDNAIPLGNLAQIHACMFVLDRAWWDYVSYAGGWPLHVIRVHRSETWDDGITAALTAFEERAVEAIARYRAITVGLPVAPRIDHFTEIEF